MLSFAPIWLYGILPGVCPAPEPIQIVILVILGTDQNRIINDRLKEIAPELRKKDHGLTGFDLHKTVNRSIRMGESASIELVGKAKVDVTVNAKTDDAGRITLTIKPPRLEEIQYACTCGKFLPILTNYYTQDKQRLIIAIMAKPCKQPK